MRRALGDVDWSGLGLSPACYWRLMARKVQADGVDEGVYSVPPAGSSLHAAAVRDRDLLRAHGQLD